MKIFGNMVLQGQNRVEQAAISYGTTLPASSKLGELFYLSSTKDLYISDGVSWERVIDIDSNISIIGDVSGNGVIGDSIQLSLSAVNSFPGIYGSETTIPVITTDDKGRVTASSAVNNSPVWTNIKLKPMTISGYGITDAYTKTDIDEQLTSIRASMVNTIPFIVGRGNIIQTVFSTISTFTGTSKIAWSTTPPVITAGSQIAALAITPTTSSPKISISASMLVDSASNSKSVIAAVFRNSVCVMTTSVTNSSSGNPSSLVVNFVDYPTGSQTYTYTIRVGATSASTWYVNQNSSRLTNGSTTQTSFVIQELS